MYPLEQLPARGAAPADRFRYVDGRGTIGLSHTCLDLGDAGLKLGRRIVQGVGSRLSSVRGGLEQRRIEICLQAGDQRRLCGHLRMDLGMQNRRRGMMLKSNSRLMLSRTSLVRLYWLRP